MPRVVVGHGVDPFHGAAADVDVLEGLGRQHRVVGRACDPAPCPAVRIIRPEPFEESLFLQPEPVGASRFIGHARVHLALAFHGMGESPAEYPRPVAAASVVGVGLGQIQLPHAPDPVARVPQADIIGRDMAGQVAVVVQATKPGWLVPAGQADAGRGADRRVRGALRKADSAVRQPVQVRRAYEGRPRGGQVVVAVLVVHDEEEVGASGAGHDGVSLLSRLIPIAIQTLSEVLRSCLS